MPTHILVNSLGLTHKGTIGMSAATIPDVCKTPSPGGPVPLPYPNFADQSSLQNGTTTVSAMGEMIAIKGSQYGRSNGDEAGTAGGVKSNVNMQATDWITYSFDVKMEGQNACRHTDLKFHNNQNTVDLNGNVDPAALAQFQKDLCSFLKECTMQEDKNHPTPLTGTYCKSKGSPDPHSKRPRNKAMERGANIDTCVENKINAMKTSSATDPVLAASVKTQEWVDVPIFGGRCRPDVIVGTPPHCQKSYDIKTSCPPLPKDTPQPKWPVYGSGRNGTRKANQKDWYGYDQKTIAHLATGAEPEMIHSNSDACK